MSTSHAESPADSTRHSAELDELAYVAGHDLQEPLRKLLAYCKLLPQDLEGQLPERAKSDLKFIVDAAQHMQQLLHDWISLARIGSVALQSSEVDLDQCADKALALFAQQISMSRATVDRDCLPRVCGDAGLLTQLYQHLIDNALKFCGDKPPRIHLTARFEDGTWTLGVRDEGIGIKPEHGKSIFAPFNRLHPRERYDGTGIGLAICRKIVSRHGGRIWVESRPECGAHFKFSLAG